MRIYKLLALTFLLLGLPSFAQAQFISKDIIIGDTTQMHVLNTENGDRFVGRVTKIENTSVFLLLKNIDKEVEFNLAEISSLTIYNATKDKQSAFLSGPNPDYIRARAEYYSKRKNRNVPVQMNGEENLIFAPTSFTHGKGKGEYRTIMVIYNRVDFGITDNIDFGLDLMPLISSNIVTPRIKAGVPLNDFVNIGFGGSLYMLFQPDFFENSFTGVTHTYGTATFGSKEKFINLGLGYGFPLKPDVSEPSTVITFGGAIRIGNRWKLVADFNLFGLEEIPDFYNIGVSWFNEKNRIDFGISTLANLNGSFFGDVLVLPFASYARSFGKG